MEVVWVAIITGGFTIAASLAGSLTPIWITRSKEKMDLRRERSEEILELLDPLHEYYAGIISNATGYFEEVEFSDSFQERRAASLRRITLIAPAEVVDLVEKCEQGSAGIMFMLEEREITTSRKASKSLSRTVDELTKSARKYAMIS